jgi:hypothetical protein
MPDTVHISFRPENGIYRDNLHQQPLRELEPIFARLRS